MTLFEKSKKYRIVTAGNSYYSNCTILEETQNIVKFLDKKGIVIGLGLNEVKEFREEV